MGAPASDTIADCFFGTLFNVIVFETNTPNTKSDTSLHPIPQNANRSGRFPKKDMAGEMPMAAKAATVKEETLMKYPKLDGEKWR
jgi:hypothetical protein